MSPWVLYHAGVGWLSSGVGAPIETTVYGGVASTTYGLTDDVGITATLANAHRINAVHGAQAHELAAQLNAREQHHRWRAMRWDAACEMAK